MIENQIKGSPEGPIAINSIFGWILCGKYDTCEDSCLSNIPKKLDIIEEFREANDDKNLNNLITKFHEVENLGINDESNVMTDFQKDLRFNGERYVCKLPIKKHHEFIPDNYSNSQRRLMSLHNRLLKNEKLCKEYDDIIADYAKNDIIEKVDHEGGEGLVHYLPHRPVIREDRETTKVRIVFDAASKVSKDEPSLNECLYSGPCLLPSLYEILLRFRMGKIGLVSDVQQAFLNIEIDEEHRDLVRFLWFKDVFAEKLEIVVYRFNRVLFGLTSSPFLLNATIAFHLMMKLKAGIDVDVIRKLLRNLYVDDSPIAVNDVKEGAEFYVQVT